MATKHTNEGTMSKIARTFSKDTGLKVIQSGTACRFIPNLRAIQLPANIENLGLGIQEVTEGMLDHEWCHAREQKEAEEARAAGATVKLPSELMGECMAVSKTRGMVCNALADIHDEGRNHYAGVERNLSVLRRHGMKIIQGRAAKDATYTDSLHAILSEMYLRAFGLRANKLNENAEAALRILAPKMETLKGRGFGEVEALIPVVERAIRRCLENKDDQGDQGDSDTDKTESKPESKSKKSKPESKEEDSEPEDTEEEEEDGNEEGEEGDKEEGEDKEEGNGGSGEEEEEDGNEEGEEGADGGEGEEEEGEGEDKEGEAEGDDDSGNDEGEGDGEANDGEEGEEEGDSGGDGEPEDKEESEDHGDSDDADKSDAPGGDKGAGDAGNIETGSLDDIFGEENDRDMMDEVRDSVSEAAADEMVESNRYIPRPSTAARDKVWNMMEVAATRRDAATLKDHYTDIKRMVDPIIGGLRSKLSLVLRSKRDVTVDPDQEEGLLDRSALYRVATGERRVFSKTLQANEDVPAVAVLVDESGSMAGSKAMTAQLAAIALGETLAALNVPFAIYGFDAGEGEALSQKAADQLDAGSSWCGRLEAVNLYQYKAFNDSFRKVRESLVLISGRGDNADGDSILKVAKILAARPEARKLLLVLSDGAPAVHTGKAVVYDPKGGIIDYTMDRETIIKARAAGASYKSMRTMSVEGRHLKDTVESVERSGIEVIGIGIQDDAVEAFYPNHIVVNSLEMLPKVLFKAAATKITNGKGGRRVARRS